MKPIWLIFMLAMLGSRLIAGDIISQTNSQGDEIVLQRDAIVIHADSSLLVYKHFDLKEHRVTSVKLSRGSLPIRIQESDEAGRARIVKVWKQFGFKASITDQAGKTIQLYDVFLDFFPPEGRGSLLESLPALTDFPVLAEGAGTDEIDFENISRVEIQGERLNIVQRDGKTVTGKFVLPTDKPVEVRLLGITDNYDPASDRSYDYSAPLSQLKSISFQ
jgi:hypothetical protein